jgi:hypothetical protein
VKTEKKVKHPLVKELLLGRTVEEVCDELRENYEFRNDQTCDKLEDIVKALVKANKPNVVFYAEERDYCSVYPINLKDWEIDLDYWDHEDGFWLEDEAICDCDTLNKIVEDLFGERKPHKVTRDQEFLLKKKGFACPCCGGQGIQLDQIVHWKPLAGLKNRDRGEVVHEIGCKKCGYTWENSYKVTLDRVG